MARITQQRPTGAKHACRWLLAACAALPVAAWAAPFEFSTGLASDALGTASRQASSGRGGIESADDFVLGQATSLDHASFTGLLPSGFNVSQILRVGFEIYRLYPADSTTPPSGRVPSRTNSPADLALAGRDSAASNLSFVLTTLNPSFTVMNSVQTGINPVPNQNTGGDGPAVGAEVRFDLAFSALSLAADHYFFVPEVLLSTGDFLWLSALRPIVAPGTPFAPDLQSWIRNDALAPDWLRVGTDILGAGTFNGAFTLSGSTVPGAVVPEPATLLLVAVGVLAGALRRRVVV